MPTPREGETRDDFMSRCVEAVQADGAASDADQASAMCSRMWDDESSSKSNPSNPMDQENRRKLGI